MKDDWIIIAMVLGMFIIFIIGVIIGNENKRNNVVKFHELSTCIECHIDWEKEKHG
jgi:hypothetical protein